MAVSHFPQLSFMTLLFDLKRSGSAGAPKTSSAPEKGSAPAPQKRSGAPTTSVYIYISLISKQLKSFRFILGVLETESLFCANTE